MQDRHGPHWRQYARRARGDESGGELDVYALLKTLLDLWGEHFRLDAKLRKARSFISLALDARNSAAHFTGDLGPREVLRHLDAMRELVAAVGAAPQTPCSRTRFSRTSGRGLRACGADRRSLDLMSVGREPTVSALAGGAARRPSRPPPGGSEPQNFETDVSLAVMNSRRAGCPSRVARIPRSMAGTISAGSVTRSPWAPNARAIAA